MMTHSSFTLSSFYFRYSYHRSWGIYKDWIRCHGLLSVSEIDNNAFDMVHIRRPGTDLIAKADVPNPYVVNVIASRLAIDRMVQWHAFGRCPWTKGARSPTHRYRIQATKYYLQAYGRYKQDLILLIFCIDKLSIEANVYKPCHWLLFVSLRDLGIWLLYCSGSNQTSLRPHARLTATCQHGWTPRPIRYEKKHC